MIKNIKVTIRKEDKYNINDLINDIKDDPKSAYELCNLYGCEGFAIDAFKDFDGLTQEAMERLIEDLAISKSEADAELSESQLEKFELLCEYLEEDSTVSV
jgi:hypothetical protein